MKQGRSSGKRWQERWHRLRAHPIFPVLLFVLASSMLDENYPFSKYSMYSNPSSRPLHYHYLVDAEGKPLPIKFHTRLTPSKITKTLRKTREQVREELGIAKDTTDQAAANRVESLAGQRVIERLWKESRKLASKRHLPSGFGLVEVTISYRDKRFVEEERALAHHQP